MAVAHLALDLGLGDHRCHRVHNHDIHCTGADQCLGDLQCLLTGIRLGYQQGIDVHAQRLGIVGIQCVFHIDEHRRTAALLAFCHNMQCNGGFTAAFRPIDLDDTPLGDTTDAQRNIQRQTAGGNGLYIQCGMLAQTHHRTLAKLLFDLSQCGIQCLLLFRSNRCVLIFRLLNSHIKTSVFAKILSAARSDSRKNAAISPADCHGKGHTN